MASGALAGSATDYGINDDFIRQIGKTVPVGSGAVFILAQDFNLDKLMPRLEKYEGRARVIQTSLSDADEARLGTDPHEADSDGDTVSDGDEVYVDGTDPAVPEI